MTIWALADLHLAIAVPSKDMAAFGEPWNGYMKKIEYHWKNLIHNDDLVLLAGDISWSLKLKDAKIDLEWIASLPGTKVMVRGNHDYWWSSLKQVEEMLPRSVHIIQNNSWKWGEYVIGGAKLYDSSEYDFKEYIHYTPNPLAKVRKEELTSSEESEKLFTKELGRLELSLKDMDRKGGIKIAMTHYPPIGAQLLDSKASKLLEAYDVNICVFGHLHNVKKDSLSFGKKNGVEYYLTAADYLDFKPIKIR